MRVAIIGGTGHVGTHLVPRLVELGHEVISLSRGKRDPYTPHGAWSSVHRVEIDRQKEDAAGTFAKRIADLKADVVIDMICFTPESCRQLIDALRGKVRHFLHCGTIWVQGHSEVVPTPEEHPKHPLEKYGRDKSAIEDLLLDAAQREAFPATVIRPGHIVGQGWLPVNPAGNFNPSVFRKLSRGEELLLPNDGLETLHHVHADDVAQAFIGAMNHWSSAVGEAFNVTSEHALTLRGFAKAVAAWFGKSPNLAFLPLAQWRKSASEADADATAGHVLHSQCASIAKAQRLLQYRPRYSSLQAVFESMQWAIKSNMIEI